MYRVGRKTLLTHPVGLNAAFISSCIWTRCGLLSLCQLQNALFISFTIFMAHSV